jgi:glucarate dehydratase
MQWQGVFRMRVTNVSITVVDVPQVWPIAPYRSHIRTSSSSSSAIVRIDTDEGLVGWGEHNVNFLPGVSARAMTATAREWLTGKDPTNIAAFHRDCRFETRLKSGVEMALWDIKAQAAGVPLAMLLGGIVRTEVELAACMGIQPYEQAGEIARHYVEQGYSTLKTKAGSSAEEDLAMIRGIRDAVGDRLKVRMDPNRAYSLDEAVRLAAALEEFDLEYWEQPIPAEPLDDARRLREATRVPIALNESVTDPASVLAILKADAAAFILPDTPQAGGLWPCVEIGLLCAAAGLPCIMHCGHDMGPKTAAMVHVAAAVPSYTLANDSTYYGLVEDVCETPLPIRNGRIAVPTTPGLGVRGDAEKLAKYRRDC